MKDFIKRNIRPILFGASILLTVLLGVAAGIILVFQRGFPQQIENLEDIKPVVMTTVFDRHAEPVRDFAIEKRRIVRRTDLPDALIHSLVASEDRQFYSHWGINFKGTIRAIIGRLFGRDWGGGSSITQQLARGLFLTPRVSLKRKLNEMLLAIQIEKNYTKEQIITYYCNKIFLGGSVYGVEAAARYYFGKSVSEINVQEAALLTALIPSPNVLFNAFRNPGVKDERVAHLRNRRNRILKHMQEMGFIDQATCRTAQATELPTKPYEAEHESLGDYFLEEARRYLEAKYGDNLLYKGGLKVYTTLDPMMQGWAEEALKEGLRELDKRRGWRVKPGLTNLAKKGEDILGVRLPEWRRMKLRVGAIVPGIVTEVQRKSARVRISHLSGKLDAREAAWTRLPLTRILRKGDVALFRLLEIPEGVSLEPSSGESTENQPPLRLGLEQEPEVQGAIMVVDNETGQVRAMVGGYDFSKSEFNNATQAGRQTGSTFKPIIYTAALENGYTPATVIVDEPFSYYDAKIDEIWEPRNITLDFLGPLTLRRALQKSRNVISAKLVEQLTPARIVDYGRRFGITSDLQPFMSISLGSFGVSLQEMVAAFTVFPNLGTRVTPYLIREIRDPNGHIIEEGYPDRKMVVDRETAYVMNYLLQGVVQMGSGWRARHLEAPIGGKTGTTNDNTDAWFIGFSPSITVGVWVGYSIPRSMGEGETGSRAATPVFVRFMEKYLETHPEKEKTFPKPPGVVFVKIDGFTGKIWTPECLHPLNEAFVNGTEPTEFCRPEEHIRFQGYYDNIPDTEEAAEMGAGNG
ncbi:MAG: PBP1A family penicillin-binding protein [Acidobacteriota bacterium]|jgi:penicillin-binding protein 1A|nr:PBP1A family penicillin-binding protein [Acidobacteriota bacterium]